jgi:hypothetical protein
LNQNKVGAFADRPKLTRSGAGLARLNPPPRKKLQRQTETGNKIPPSIMALPNLPELFHIKYSRRHDKSQPTHDRNLFNFSLPPAIPVCAADFHPDRMAQRITEH